MYVLQVKEYFEKTGYTSDDKPVDIQVLSDKEIVTTTVQDVTDGWSAEIVCNFAFDMPTSLS